MKRLSIILLLSVCAMPVAQAIEVLRWNRLPLTIALQVGQERVILVDRNVRVGVPPTLADRLRVQSAGGALYLRADAPIESTRLQLQDADSGAVILVDIHAAVAGTDAPALEPIRIVDGDPAQWGDHDSDPIAKLNPARDADASRNVVATPVPVVLTRFAAQSFYTPLRTVEPVIGVTAVSVQRGLSLDTLLPSLPVRTQALAAWRLDDYWLTAILLTHTADGWLTLDPRLLQGDFVAATFQHRDLGPAGDPSDTTVVYLITRGHGLREALLPAISPVDTSINLPRSTGDQENRREE